MSKSYWKTETLPLRPRHVERPSLGQVLRQIGVALLVVALWGVIFALYLDMTSEEEAPATAVPPPSTAVAAAPTSTPTSAPTDFPTPTKRTPTATPSLVPSATSIDAGTTVKLSPIVEAVATDTPPPTETAITPTEMATQVPTPTELPASATPAVPSAETNLASFANDVLPILESRCVKCHGGERTEEGLDLTTYAALMAGSWNGSVLVPGNAEDSYFVELIISGDMPKRAPRLLPREIEFIVDWVNAGAPNN